MNYYNKYTKEYYEDLSKKSEGLHFKETKKNIFKLLKPKKGDKILDIGCGSGRLGLYLMSLGCKVTGIDRNENSIKNCKNNNYNNVFLMSCDNIKLNKTFDKILCSALVEHIPNKVYINMLKEIKKILKPEGILVIYTPNPHHIFERITKKEEHIGLKNMKYLKQTLMDNEYKIQKSYFKPPYHFLLKYLFPKRRICIRATL